MCVVKASIQSPVHQDQNEWQCRRLIMTHLNDTESGPILKNMENLRIFPSDLTGNTCYVCHHCVRAGLVPTQCKQKEKSLGTEVLADIMC